MSTTLVKPAEVERKWYLLDAAGKSLGHVAAEAAVLLRGKQKVDYTPNVDCGDFVVVINCDKAVLTGKKAEQKFHITHSKYIGGLKKVQYSKLMAENSDRSVLSPIVSTLSEVSLFIFTTSSAMFLPITRLPFRTAHFRPRH